MRELFKANCITCRKVYNSEGSQHDGGECFSCRFSFNSEMIKMIDSKRKQASTSTKNKPRILPKNLDRDLDLKIMKFFCENYGVLFNRKHLAFEAINKEFNTSFSSSEVEAICTVPRMVRAGFNYAWRSPERSYYFR